MSLRSLLAVFRATLRNCFAAVVIVAEASTAQAIPVAQYSGYVRVAATGSLGGQASPQNFVIGAGTFSEALTGFYGDTAFSQAVVSNGPDPSVTLTTALSSPVIPPDVGVAGATAAAAQESPGSTTPGVTLSYFLEIAGPTGTVPIDVNAMVAASSPALPPGAFLDEITTADFSVVSNSGFLFGDSVYIDNTGPGSNAFTEINPPSGFPTITPLVYSPATGLSGALTESDVWMAQTNVLYEVNLVSSNVTEIAGQFGGGSMDTSAMVDPTFHLDPSVTNPSLYAILLSDGIGNSPNGTAPEPATLALLAIGLAGLGLRQFAGYLSRRLACDVM